jgi:flagellar biosynthetic protein FliQ
MNAEFAVEMIKNMMGVAVLLVAPILLAGVLVGLCISLFQAVTAIHEQTLTFAPKALVMVAVIVILLPWMLRHLIEYGTAVIQRIPDMVR